MKKIIFATLIFILSSLSSHAQDFRGFRGFFDIYGGIGVGRCKDSFKVQDADVSDFGPKISFGLNVTGGYQITDYLFAGVGFGGYTVVDEYDFYNQNEYGQYEYRENIFPAVMLPIFADCRWTLDINRKINPFVDLKIGYQFRCQLNEGRLTYFSNNNEIIYMSQEPGFFCQPTVGVRFGGRSAFNLGITYNPTIHQKFYRSNQFSKTEIKKCSQGAFMLSLGADF
ncbi:MAG: porin family protein [Muribaculaceae bacterium]|nr:porin family protein [Muribaculaceae bacterium]MDE7109981.1 porin family protein [Muribaculaceae bacterium]